MHLEPKEIWSIIDASKLQDFMQCARYYFFTHILGWRWDAPNIHLEFGSAIHIAMDYLLTHGYGKESVLKAYLLFEDYYREYFSEFDDEENAPKIPINVLVGLPKYVNQYRAEDAQDRTLFTEIAGSVLISETDVMYFKMDSVLYRPNRGIFSRDHKTGSSFGKGWAEQWTQSTQMGMYAHALQCMLPLLVDKVANPVFWGMEVNGLFFRNAPQLKQDGTLYANARDTEFHRIPILRGPEHMNDWLYTTQFWYDWLKTETAKLPECSDSDDVLMTFPKNPKGCDKYGGCRFMDFCSSWANPLRRCEKPPTNYIVEFWDPRSTQETANKVVEL